MKTAPRQSVSKQSLRLAALACALGAASESRALDLIKADNTSNMNNDAGGGVVLSPSSYTNTPPALTGTGDTIVFDNTLVTNSTFSWGADSVTGVKVMDPAGAITVNMGGSGTTLSFSNSSSGVVIDMSGASKNLTFVGGTGKFTVRGSGAAASSVATFSVASGRTLGIQTNLQFNNSGSSNSTNTIRMAGAGDLTVNGTNGKISDKTPASSVFTAFVHDGTGTVTFSNANTYTGGTTINSGTLVAGNVSALGNGSATVTGGTLDLNGSSIVDLTFAADKDFTFSGGSLKFDLGAGSDQISSSNGVGGIGKFNITGGTFVLTPGIGFSYSTTYQLFENFNAGTSIVSGLAFSGFDTAAYQASLSASGLLSFTAIPEPSSFAVLAGGLVLAGCAARRRTVRRA